MPYVTTKARGTIIGIMKRKKSSARNQSSTRRRRLTPETVIMLKQVLFGVLLATVLGGLLTGIWYGTRVAALTLDKVTVSGGETISHVMVESIATETLAGTYFKLVPRQFAWLYPETEIIQNIYALERVQSIHLERIEGTELEISITEYLPTALWCSEEAAGACLFVDETGYAFTTAPDLTGGAFVRYTTLGREPTRGEQLVPVDDLAAVTWLYTTLEDELGWSVVQIEIDTVGDVFYTLRDRSELKVTLAADPAETYANLVTVLDSDSFTDLAPGDFQYIDLRFGNKVFVNREPWETFATSTASSTFAWDELIAEGADVPGTMSTPAAVADDEDLAVPLVAEADEAVLIEPTPEEVVENSSTSDTTSTSAAESPDTATEEDVPESE